MERGYPGTAGVRTLFFMVLCCVVMGLFFPLSLSADIYKFVDEEGITHITNIPTDPRYRLWIIEPRPERKDVMKLPYDSQIMDAAEKYNVEPHLIRAVIKAESDFNQWAISRKGARGLMQLMPGTAYRYRVNNHFDPWSNIEGGVRYLRYLLDLFRGDLTLALAAYNAGEGAVAKYNNRVPPYQETQTYVKRVKRYLEKFRSEAKKSDRTSH